MEQLNNRLLQIKYKINERKRLQNMIEKLVNHQRSLEIKKSDLLESLKKEELDVEKIEGISISGFIHMIKGDREDVLEKEKQEALAAKLKYDEACRELENISEEIKKISGSISDFGDLDKEYMELIRQKENLINSGAFKGSDAINNIIEEQAELRSREKELKEAVDAGLELMDSLNRVRESLQSASNWGTWDMLGGGLIATMAKHSRIDEAQGEIERAQSLLRRFHRELQDVGGTEEINIDIGSFLTFADYFFDGIFVDWAVQSRIHEAQDKVEDTVYKVQALMLKLHEELEYMVKRFEELDEERLGIIENA